MTPGKRIPFNWKMYGLAGLVVLVGLVASFGWNMLRDRVVEGVAAWRAQEAQAGREWTCPDESVSGFPFRIEIRCTAPTLNITNSAGKAFVRLEGLTIVSQIYDSEHIIAQAIGPMSARLADGSTLDINWRSLSTSVTRNGNVPQRFSMVVEGPALRLSRADIDPATLFGERFEFYVRPNPQRYASEGAIDLALNAPGVTSPLIDAAIGGRESLDVSLQATTTRAYVLAGQGGPAALETWRLLGGTVAIAPLTLTKGSRRLVARGDLGIDETRRLTGRIDMAAAGLEDIYNRIAGNDPRLGALIATGMNLLAARQGTQAGDGLKPVLPLRFEKGRYAFGPFILGELPPLY